MNEQAIEYGFIQKEETPPQPIKIKPSASSFKYINKVGGYENITDLLKSLKKNNLVDEKTTIANFRSIFSGKGIEQKIIWTGNISELAHFIKTLHNTAKKVEDTKQKQWDITINCFDMANGTVLTNQKLKQQQAPANAAIIEKAVNIL